MRYKLRKGQQRLPLGGHHYTSHGVVFKADNLNELVAKVMDYRLNNMFPVGDVEQEILAAYYDHSPWMVDPDPTPERKKNPYYAQWRGWIHHLWKHHLHRTITRKEAETRWSVCENCPHNVRLAVDGSPEGSETLRRAFLLRRGQETSKKLGFCSLHLWDNSIASFLEEPSKVSRKPKDAADHSGCWVPSSLTEP